MKPTYTLYPIQLGCEVYDVNLCGHLSKDTINQIKKDVAEHKIVVFRNQHNLPPEKHLEIARWFGKVESTFYRHPKSPSQDIFRVSNDDREGCTNVGRTGWHIDGSFMKKPFSHSLYHIISVPERGSTSFISLSEVVSGLSQERRNLWNRLWMVSDRRSGLVHPLIYTHPETGLPTLCFHLGMTEGFILDYGSYQQRDLSVSESFEILQQIKSEIMRDKTRIYHHVYKPGDFIISDNLAVGHEASPETQHHRENVGLRIMHRVTVAGKTRPGKSYDLIKDLNSEVSSCPGIEIEENENDEIRSIG